MCSPCRRRPGACRSRTLRTRGFTPVMGSGAAFSIVRLMRREAIAIRSMWHFTRNTEIRNQQGTAAADNIIPRRNIRAIPAATATRGAGFPACHASVDSDRAVYAGKEWSKKIKRKQAGALRGHCEHLCHPVHPNRVIGISGYLRIAQYSSNHLVHPPDEGLPRQIVRYCHRQENASERIENDCDPHRHCGFRDRADSPSTRAADRWAVSECARPVRR